MANLDREGRFKAIITERQVAETGDNKLCTFQARYAVQQELVDGVWYDISEEKREISGYHYMEKKDGSVNTNTIDKLKDALGWDGADVDALDSGLDLSEKLVKITCEFEEYNGNTRLKVKWLDNENAEPAMKKVSEAEKKAIASRFGSKLRANAGGTTVPVKPPAGRPTAATPAKPASVGAAPAKPAASTAVAVAAPNAASKPPARPKPAGPKPTINSDIAWGEFQKKFGSDVGDEHIEQQWYSCTDKVLGQGRDLMQVTSDEWHRFLDECSQHISPY